MKLSNFSIPVLRDSVVAAMSRFPIALICAFASALISMYLIQEDRKEPELNRVLISLATGLPWLTGLHLISENYLKNKSQRLILFATGILFLVLVFLFIAPDFDENHLERPIRFLSFFLIAHLLVSLAPFFKSGKINEFWEYNKNAFVIWYVGAFYALIIYLGLTIALAAVDNLFNVRISWKLYAQIFVIIAAVFHPLYVLSDFPTGQTSEQTRTTYTKAIRHICFYILIPLTILYFFILYAYSFKIVSSWNLPRGWVSSLVLGFSGIGMITYLLNYLLPHLEDSKLSLLFKKYFFYILSPLVILLFVAIIRRLADYGFTPPRYFVLITGIWLFFSCIYFILSKTNNIKLIPMSLIVFLVVGTMSPFDAFHTSYSSQYRRLVSLLEKNKMLENSKIKSSLVNLEPSEKESIKEIMYALDKMGDLKYVNSLLTEPIPFDTILHSNPDEILFEKLGLTVPSENIKNSKTIYLSSQDKNDYTITGYDRIYLFNLYKGTSDENISLIEQGAFPLIICKKNNDTIPIHELLMNINQRNNKSQNESILDNPFDLSTHSNKYRLHIINLNYVKSDNKLSLDYMHAVLLVGKK